MQLKKSVSLVVLFPNDKLLIQSHVKLGKLNIPCGALEDGESPLEGIQREIKEELGVDLTEKQLGNYEVIMDERLASKDGYREYRYTIHVSHDFTWDNVEPQKHNWIKPMSICEILDHELESSIILSGVISDMA